MIALFIGRFQPFHKGHLHCLKYISKKAEHIIICIGSSNVENTIDNPLNLDERIILINKVIKNERELKPITIIHVPDVNDNSKWTELVIEEVRKTKHKNFDCVFTNNELVKELFEIKGYCVCGIPFFMRELFQGMIIRKKAEISDTNWKKYVPDYLLPELKEIKFEERLIAIAQKIKNDDNN
ncbi:MAG: nicotinamide-nucleotide adenylyltransferase [Candidatus Micrarchaeota archaeon]|nr:nicotinamide-nucleotide adenylyltransferase [Candidatus Micrarchaeota archaeon]